MLKSTVKQLRFMRRACLLDASQQRARLSPGASHERPEPPVFLACPRDETRGRRGLEPLTLARR